MRVHSVPTAKDLTGIVLAGGRGQRMGGVNKGLVAHGDQVLAEYAADLLRSHVGRLLVVTNTQADAYRALGFECTDDGAHAWEGPLAGLLAGLRAATTDWIAAVPCDAISCAPDLYPRLLEAAANSAARLACGRDEENLQPAFCVLSQALMPALEHALADKRRALGRWMREQDAVEVQCPGDSFSNLNTRNHLDPA